MFASGALKLVSGLLFEMSVRLWGLITLKCTIDDDIYYVMFRITASSGAHKYFDKKGQVAATQLMAGYDGS